jgi:hypothetical protein
MIDIPSYKNKKELFDFLVKNKDVLIAQKKAVTKHADGIGVCFPESQTIKEIYKGNNPIEKVPDDYEVMVVMNTTNFLDSHLDVHIPGLWKKTLNENKFLMHLQEHSMKFDKIISEGDDLKAFTKQMSFKELGFDYEGTTEALIFDSILKKANKEPRNSFMAEQYSKGYVKNHSVGMRYVKIVMAINDEDYGAEYEAWEKYFSQISNKEFAEEKGFFWAVKEAKLIEGSAVPLGSNMITPTLDNNMKNEPSTDTHKQNNQPLNNTGIDYKYLKNNLIF